MKLLCVICALVALAVAVPPPYDDHCIVGEKNVYNASRQHEVPWFTVNLDLPPAERWLQISAVYKTRIENMLGAIKGLAFPFFHGHLVQWVDSHVSPWDNRLPQPYRDELKGIANATGIPLGEIVLYNIFYEVFTVCTSIVAEDPQGKLYHARNLDFGLFMGWDARTHDWLLTEMLRPLIVNLDWRRGGRSVFKSVNFAGFVGVYNGLRPGRFSLTANERYSLDGGYVGLIGWLLGLTPDARLMTFHARDVLLSAEDFDEAVDMLSTQQLMSPVYYIVGGNSSGQGVIVTRARTNTLDVRHLEGHWYLLETNYDPLSTPLYLDDRRTPGRACMDKLTREGASFQGLFNVLSSKTNLNKLTVYTVLMQVESGRFETYIQKCTDPCYAW